jgi:hypothetical protein
VIVGVNTGGVAEPIGVRVRVLTGVSVPVFTGVFVTVFVHDGVIVSLGTRDMVPVTVIVGVKVHVGGVPVQVCVMLGVAEHVSVIVPVM